MIPTLKQEHEKRIKRQLIEFNKNPKLIVEFNQNQLDEMDRALDKLRQLFKNPEFKKLTTFHLGLQKAATNLSDLLSSNKITRIIKLKSEFRAIAAFADSVGHVFKKFPKIVKLMQDGLAGTDNWDPNEPLIQALDRLDSTRMKSSKLHGQFVKAMKSGLFGKTDIPYINSDEAARELISLSFNELVKVQQAVESSKTVRQTIVNPAFMHSIKQEIDQGADGSIDEPTPVDEPEKTENPKPTIQLPEPEKQQKKVPSVRNIQKVMIHMFDQAYKDTYPERQIQGRGMSDRDRVLRGKFTEMVGMYLKTILDDK